MRKSFCLAIIVHVNILSTISDENMLTCLNVILTTANLPELQKGPFVAHLRRGNMDHSDPRSTESDHSDESAHFGDVEVAQIRGQNPDMRARLFKLLKVVSPIRYRISTNRMLELCNTVEPGDKGTCISLT